MIHWTWPVHRYVRGFRAIILALPLSCVTVDLEPPVTPVEPGPEICLEERLLDTLPLEVEPSVSPSGRHAGYALKERMIVDGHPGETFDSLGKLTFSEDGDHWGYTARVGNRWFRVCDGEKIECPGEPYRVEFDLQNRQVPYLTLHGKPDLLRMPPCSVEIDGIESPIWEAISRIVSDDRHTRTAYFGRQGSQLFPVIDGIESEPFQANLNIRPGLNILPTPGTVYEEPSVSRDGRHVGYVIPENGRYRLVIDDVKGPLLDGVSGPWFSDDGSRVGSFEHRGGKWHAVVDGVVNLRFEVKGDHWCFSPTLDHVAWVESEEGRKRVVVDGIPGPWFVDLNHFQFSPDGRHVAYLATETEKPGRIMGWLTDGCVVKDGRPLGPEHEGVYPITFSPDSRRIAYATGRGERHFLICEEREAGPYDYVHVPVFSPDSRHLCFEAKRAGKHLVVVDGRDSEPVDRIIGGPRFSRDGRHVGYGALIGRELWWKVISVP